MSLGFFVHEVGRLSYANESCSRISGYSLKELEAMPSVYSLVVPEQRDLLLEHLRCRRHGQQVVEHYESVIVRKDGQRLDVELVIKPLRDGDERQAVLLRDITDRKNPEKAIKESEDRFRSAFENASTGVALVELDRGYLKVNRALCALLGYEKEELLTKVSSEITHPEDLKKGEERTEQLLSGYAETSSLEKRYIRKDGSVVWAISDVSLVRDAEGNPSHFVSQFQDITDRKSVEEVPAITYVHAQHPGGLSTTAYISPQIETVLGYTPEECTSDPDHWTKVLHPEDKVVEGMEGSLGDPGTRVNRGKHAATYPRFTCKTQ